MSAIFSPGSGLDFDAVFVDGRASARPRFDFVPGAPPEALVLDPVELERESVPGPATLLTLLAGVGAAALVRRRRP